MIKKNIILISSILLLTTPSWSSESVETSSEEVVENTQEEKQVLESILANETSEEKATDIVEIEIKEEKIEDAVEVTEAPITEPQKLEAAPVAEVVEEKELAEKTEEAKEEVIEKNEEIKEIIQSASLVETGLKSGFYNFSYDCSMREKAGINGKIVGLIRKGKRLWVDDHKGRWVTVYRTSGPAYVHQNCL